MRSRTAVFQAGFLIVSAFMGLRAAEVEKFVGPGDTGRILLSIENVKESAGPLAFPRIELTSNPNLQVEGTSILEANLIAPNDTHDFVVAYSISAEAPQGPFSIVVMPRSATEGLQPGLDTADTTITFKVDAVAPSLTIYDSRGLLAANGATQGTGMLFAADDRAGPGGQPATVVGGIEKIDVFTDPPTNEHRIGGNSTPYAEHHTYALSELGLTSLPEGRIHVTITDRAGNMTSRSFIVDRVAPTITLANNEGVAIAAGELMDSGFITATCADSASGVDQISILNGSGGAPLRGPIYENGVPEVTADFADLPDNISGENYIARVVDAAGNQTDFPFRVGRAPFVELSFTATHQYDYVFQYYGASVQTFSIPYSTAAFFIRDSTGIGGFELKRNGVVLVSESYPADTFTMNVSRDLADGDYEFRVDTVRGQSTSGTFTKYSVGVTPILTRPQATARLESGQFLVNFPVTCSNNGPAGTGLSALTIRRVGVNGFGQAAQHVFQGTVASLACGQSYDGHLSDGLYAVVGLDRGYEIARYFRIDTQPAGLPLGFYKGITNQVNTELFGQTLALTHDGQGNYAASGSAETAPAELFSSTDNFVVPYGAFGVALTTPTESALDFATFQGTYTDVAGDTGLSQAFEISVDSGAFESIARWKLFFTDRLAECGGANPCPFDFDYHLDQNLTAARVLGSTIKLRQTLTTNSAVYRGNAPGTVTPLAGGPILPLFYIMASTVALEDMPLDSAVGMPLIAGGPAFQISTYLTKVIVELGDPNDPTIRAKIAELGSRGQQLAGGDIAKVDPLVVRFNAPTVATMRFDPAAATARGIALNDLALYQAEPGGNFYRVANQALSVSQGFISAPVLTLSQASLFAIFGPGTAPSAPVADVLPPRTAFSGNPSSTEAQTISVSSLSVLGFSAPDDKVVIGDAQGVGVQRTYYAVDGGGFVVSPGTFSLVAEGTHTLTFFSVDLLGNAEQTKTQSAAVDLTPPSGVVVSSRALFAISAIDPLVNGASSGVDVIRFLIDFPNPDSCSGAVPNPLAAPGTCENQTYSGPFPLSNGPHTVAFRVTDKVGNDSQWQSQQLEVVPQSENGGLGIGRDAFDSFWNVLNSAQSIGFARFSAFGVLLSSAALEDAVSGMPWSVFFDSSDRAYAVGGAGGPTTQAVDLAVYKAAEDGGAIESRTLFDSGYANNDMVFDAKAPGWIVGAAQTSGPADFEAPGDREFSLALWKFDPALGTVQLKTTYARAGFDLGASLAVDADGSLWIAGYSLSPAAPAVGGFDLALWHYAADGQTVLGGPFLRPGYLDNIDGGLTARVFVSSQAVFVAAPRADADGGTGMAFLRYDKATGQPTSETAWRSADGASAYPVAILPTASGLLVAGGIGDTFTEAALWRFAMDGALQSATTADAGGARGAVFRGSELWLAVDGSSIPYRVQTEAPAAGALIDLQPPRTALSAGDPSFVDGETTYTAGATLLGFTVVDDNAVVGDGLGAGATQTFYADGAGAYVRFTSSFTLVAEGTHTLSFFSIDLKGHAEAGKTSSVAVDLTAPSVVLISSGTVFTLSAVDPVVGGASAGVGQVLYLVDQGPDCEGIPESTSAAHGTCENPFYAGPFELAVGTHTVYFAASDRVLNGDQAVYSSFVTVEPTLASIAVMPSTASIPAGTTAQFAAAGTFTDGSTRTLTAGLTWSTDVSSVAQVDASGLATGVAGGTAHVLASSGAISGQALLSVSYVAMSAVTVKGAPEVTLVSTAPFSVAIVSTAAGAGAVALGSASAQGLMLVGAVYSVTRQDPGATAILTWHFDPTLVDAAALSIWRFDGISWSSVTVLNQVVSVAGGVGTVMGEVVRTSLFGLFVRDTAAPITSLSILGGRQFPGPGAASFYASSDTRFDLPASDPLAGGVASGLALTQYQDNGGAFSIFTSAFGLAEGAHLLAYRSRDNFSNLEVLRSTTVLIDATAPVSSATIGSPLFIGADGARYITPITPVTLSAFDPLVNAVASGVDRIEIAIDGGAYAAYASALTFAEGRHTILFRALDRVGNVELMKSATVFVDATSPVTALSIGNPKFDSGSGRPVFVAAATPLTLSAQDPVVQDVASGVRRISFRRSGDPFGAYSASFTLTLPDGLKTVDYFAADNVGNAEAARSASVALDDTAPLTSLSVLGGRQFAGPNTSTFYASSDTRFALPAADPVAGGVASGLALTQSQDNGGAFTTFAWPFGLTEGAHALGYRSQDKVRNVEVLRSTNVWVDAAPPLSSFAFAAPYDQAPDGTNYVAPATPLTFAAVDPALPTGQPGSGVSRIEVAVDGAPFAVYAASLTFAEGRHTILFRAIDNVANVEATRTLNVQSDATPPDTTLALLGGHQFPGPNAGSFFASADARFSLTAADPAVNNVASGVAFTQWQDNGGAFQTFNAALTFAEGVHALAYRSRDNVSNLEILRSTTALVDATPPLTNLIISGGRQFPGPDAITFYASSDTRLVLVSIDPTVNGVASGLAFTQWRDNGGAFQSYLSSLNLAEGAHALGYQSADNVQNMEVVKSTTALIDATPPATTVSIGLPAFTTTAGTIYIAPATPISFAAVDPVLPTGQTGSGLARIETSLDGAPFAAYAAALMLAEGRHTILYRAVDNVGNVEAAHSLALQSDAMPPVSALVIGAPQFQLPGVLLVSTRTPFSITVVDPVTNSVASGVKDTNFRVSDITPSPAAFSVFTVPFAMAGADVNKVVEFFSRDNVLNTEAVKSSTVLLDSTPPEVALLSPASCGSGICRVLKGKLPVLGTARDPHFGNYRLEFASGQNAASGFSLISSGTLAVSSGTLGVWDTTALTGWFTLRLTATDLVANAASLAVNVFVGDPGELLTLGNHEVFSMPTGVAVGGDGKIYVADRDNNRVAVFSSTGALLASFGGRGHDDDHRLSTVTLRLAEPSGVAVDADGNIYVADTDHDRVLKLSAAGQILLSIGRPEREHEERHDDKSEERGHRRPGRLHEPAGVAVDAARNIYVADTDNRRVQVFSSTGAFTLQFDLPAVPAYSDRDNDDHDDDAAALGKPFGIALDAAGNIYVADPKGGRALKFGATGRLLLTIPIPGDKPGTFGRPYGIAISTGGDCVLVSDRKYSRILKFDFLGSQNLIFGTKGKIHDDDAPMPSGTIAFKKPMGLALNAEGGLFVADRNNDRIRKFGLPTGRAPLVVPPPKPGGDHIARDVVDKEDGGTVSRKDHAAVDIPSGAVARDIKVTVSAPSAGIADESSRKHAVDDKQLKVASPPVEYGPEGTKFAAPVTLTLPYTPELLALGGVDEKDLKVHYWNRDKARWEDLDSEVDAKAHTVKAKTTHFSLYQVFSGTASAAAIAPLAAADATFMFHDTYAFPNPARNGAPVTFRIQTGLADSIEVRVYDVSGRNVHSSSNFSLNPSLDDGNGKGSQYTYDHAWDVSGVGSGVYTYVISAARAGQTSIVRSGKAGVIK